MVKLSPSRLFVSKASSSIHRAEASKRLASWGIQKPMRTIDNTVLRCAERWGAPHANQPQQPIACQQIRIEISSRFADDTCERAKRISSNDCCLLSKHILSPNSSSHGFNLRCSNSNIQDSRLLKIRSSSPT